MTKKDIAILLSPSLMLLVVALFAFFSVQRLERYYEAHPEHERDVAFDRFVQKVKSGEMDLTQDKMLDVLRKSHEVESAERGISVTITKLLNGIFWVALAGVWIHCTAVISVKKRLDRR